MQSSLVNNQGSSLAPLSLSCLRFSLRDIERATNDFANKIYVFNVGFGEVYRGNISGNSYSGEVFVVHFNKWLGYGTLMFENEIKALTGRHHVNIISPVGFCDENDEKILVYNFMPNGSLYDYLYRLKNPPPRLTVEQRLEICLGVAKGLCYLHSGIESNVVHGKMNTNNILLDVSLVPKISGFGYATTRVAGSSSAQEIITNRIGDANGYDTPPECHEPGYKVSRKADVYAFGVVLLEVLCERPIWRRLLVLALPFIMKGELPKFTPKHVEKNITLACARQCVKLIMNCLEFQPDKRPCMDQVVQDLEIALKLQKDHDINFEEQVPFRITLGEIERATNDFASENYIFSFDTGNVYRGNVSGNSYSGEVLVIRFYKWLSDATLKLKNEIKVLTARHHVNIISMVGFCDENDEKILVYEFMLKGSLYDYLYRHKNLPPPLTMEQRLEICLGVAKGLCYLHSGTDFNVIHGEINTINILLDADLVPKISGFGYARTRVAGPSSAQEISTNGIEGQNGFYSPPERHEPGYKLNQKADVYAFGVVMLEVLCEREPSKRLLVLALPFIMKGELPKSTPEHVQKNITPACARQCEKLIMNCLEFQPDKRPSMNQVVQDLELALKLQKDQHINFEKQSSGVNNQCHSFSLVDIKRATNEFSNTLGEGAFGKVYYGKISVNGNSVDVAVKFMSTDPKQGNPAFDIERKLLSACDHVNIISLVGYCDEGAEKVLVYEFMPNGSLYDYLNKHKDDTPRLTVEQRLEICIGVAKGLNYLHSRNDYNIIHSDLKTDNILLDANMVPKISDFGLSRTRAVGPSTSSIITNRIQGTEGYIAPECYEPNYKVSRKADVYAFGVVLLEVLCEKPAWERLVIWALPFVSKGELPKFTPEHVVKNISPECSRACANLIRDCLENDPNNRPSMSHVIGNLDLALTLQKMNADSNGQKNKSQANSQQRFSLSDIETATNKFAHQNLLGNLELEFREVLLGRKVYRGNISVDVAVKRRTGKVDQVIDLFKNKFGNEKVDEQSYLFKNLEKYFQDEINLFQNEIDLLSTCHHANVISLVGYCDEPDEKILMYEFMPNGSLYDYLHSKQDSVIHLTVEQRLEICLGVAKGLSYLHSSNIIHGYLNSKNILLDRNYVAKITSFEFSTKGVDRLSTSLHIIKRDEGMHGYFAPECYQHDYEETQEADVYAFGVIFLELLCERLARDILVELALPFIMRGELAVLTPKHVGTYISRECALACEHLLRDCIESDPNKRPPMNQVVNKLELALKLQKEGADYLSTARI